MEKGKVLTSMYGMLPFMDLKNIYPYMLRVSLEENSLSG